MKRVTLNDVARAAGLTKSAVSLALRHDPRIPVATQRRVKAWAKKLGYRQNPVIAHLMSELRRATEAAPSATIAVLNLNDDPLAFTLHPTIPTYLRGVKRRASGLGYAVDVIPSPAGAMDGHRLLRILRARSIRGCILTGMMRTTRLPRGLESLWENMPCVVTGVRTENPQLPFACADHHAVSQMAVDMTLQMGRTRPALVLDRRIDELVQGRFSAGFLMAQRRISCKARIPPFYHDDEKELPAGFAAWVQRRRPDAILTLYHVVEDWLRVAGRCASRDIVLVQLEWRPRQVSWPGVDQHNDRTGAAAVDLLIQMIHAGETALETNPRAFFIEPSWRYGNGSCVGGRQAARGPARRRARRA
jgi:DNA-binding LacI/PurR family transcriptional regulator